MSLKYQIVNNKNNSVFILPKNKLVASTFAYFYILFR